MSKQREQYTMGYGPAATAISGKPQRKSNPSHSPLQSGKLVLLVRGRSRKRFNPDSA